jgi:hypothetical protein
MILVSGWRSASVEIVVQDAMFRTGFWHVPEVFWRSPVLAGGGRGIVIIVAAVSGRFFTWFPLLKVVVIVKGPTWPEL